ncbi:PA0069 family radical SAM protein [Pontibaca methylaminivorans]|uniref:PA0069 family radical SAM protein n=1 Tax=Pontibaca methylaminivorans TaxID=515897 RepID=UPI002FDA1567
MAKHVLHDRKAQTPGGPRGRGTASNPAGRYERLHSESESDGWDLPEEETVLRREVRAEDARRIITYNRSPDLPFDRSINPYRGCEHGCIYCYARPSHAWLGLSPGLDFETRLIARPEAPRLLARELRAPSYRVAPIAIGTNTDPYQPIEKEQRITRACLEVLAAFGHPVAMVTRGVLVERDLDILGPMAARGLLRVGISLTTLDAGLARRMEPRAPAPARRLAMIRRLSEAGIPVRIMASPLVPGLTDHELEALLAAGREAGAESATWIMLRLPHEVSALWQEWLARNEPGRADKIMTRLREMHGGKDYDSRWSHRMRGEGEYARMIGHRFRLATRRLGLAIRTRELRCDLFAPPPEAGDQLSLF